MISIEAGFILNIKMKKIRNKKVNIAAFMYGAIS
tara:strand:+ start:339 stop:440 length:102 start_codon:yes stop_codon:yes gene_type:complete